METKKVEMVKFNNEDVYVDLDDILDIVPYDGKIIDTNNKPSYIMIFQTGEIWYGVIMRKTIFNKFERLKKKRGQIDNVE